MSGEGVIAAAPAIASDHPSPFTPEQEARLRELMIEHSIGAKCCGHVARRHYVLFYGECEARRDELSAAKPEVRDRLLLEIAAEAHQQELAERQAAGRAAQQRVQL